MSTNETHWMSAVDMAAAVRGGELSAREIADAMIERVGQINPLLNALVSWDPEQVRRDAAALDERQARGGPVGPLHGVPYTVKELTAVAGVQLTNCIPMFRDQIASESAPVVQRLQRAGGLFLGKTNASAMGYCGITDNKLFGRTFNPWNRDLSAGGSSGGAGAAVAAGLGPLAEGIDGGGSIRVPAAFNGVVGLKPSLGRVPQRIVPPRFVSNLFHGPLSRTVADAALMLDVMAGAHPTDPLSLPDPTGSFLAAIGGDLSGWRIAYSENLGFGDVDPEVATIVKTAVQRFDEAGATVEAATPEWGDPDQAMWEGVWVPGMAGLRGLFDPDQMHGQIDDELIELINTADTLTIHDLARADVARGMFYDAFERFMRNYRILASPTTMVASYPVTRFNPARLDGEPLSRRLLGWSLTHPFNMTSTPAVSVPCGFTADGRPVGLQLAGRFHGDIDVLTAAHVFEQLEAWLDRRPQLAG